MAFRVSQRSLEVIEWFEVQTMLVDRARTPMGRRICENYLPGELSADQAKAQALGILELRAMRVDNQWLLPLGDVPDLKNILSRITRSGAISVEEFANLVRFHKSTQALAHFLRRYAVEQKNLNRLLGGIELLEPWSRKHFELLDNAGQIVDSASEDLKALRALSRELHNKIRNRLEDFLHNPRLAEMMQDFYITVRDGRYVIPVKTNFKGRVQGIVHGVSNTEQTLFVEPQEVVEWNNQLKVAEMEIDREIERILGEVVEDTKPSVGGFERNVQIVARADLMAAGALLVESWNDRATAVNFGKGFDFVGLVHPFLGLRDRSARASAQQAANLQATKRAEELEAIAKTTARTGKPAPAATVADAAPLAFPRMDASVIANDLTWDGAFVLTGPNTGGKTVLLKAAGLGVCLAWAGLPVPAVKATLPADLSGLNADIGDDQSLEENLSTFSGHLKVLKEMIEGSGPGDIVLIDEIATGTSPEDGQPLAQAVIEALLDRNVRVFVTTHYGGLKQFAMIDERCRIASMAFDRKTRRPTYQVMMDVPGESSAFDIAERLGFPESVTHRAMALKGDTAPELNQALTRLEEARAKFQDKEIDLQKQLEEAERREAKAQEKVLEFEAKQREGLSEESRKILKDLTRLRDELSSAVKAASVQDAGAGSKSLFTKISEASDEVRTAIGTQGKYDPTVAAIQDSEIVLGAVVEVDGFGVGTISETPKDFVRGPKTPIQVKIGELQIAVPRSKILRATRERIQSHRSAQAAVNSSRERKQRDQVARIHVAGTSTSKTVSGSIICDVRGKTVEEALRKVEGCFNDLFHNESATVTIIHGHGSEKLKDAIRSYIEKERSDLHYRPGSWPGEGGDGVTLVERS